MKKLITLMLLLSLTSCMFNNDWVTHDIEITQNSITIDGKEHPEVTYQIDKSNIGITIYINEPVESFTWHFDVFNKNVKYLVNITNNNGITEIYIPHNFNIYPMEEVMKGTTYVLEEHLHFMTNIIKL